MLLFWVLPDRVPGDEYHRDSDAVGGVLHHIQELPAGYL